VPIFKTLNNLANQLVNFFWCRIFADLTYILSLRMQSPDRFGILLLCQERSIVILITMLVVLALRIVIYIFKPSFINLCSLGRILCKSNQSANFLRANFPAPHGIGPWSRLTEPDMWHIFVFSRNCQEWKMCDSMFLLYGAAWWGREKVVKLKIIHRRRKEKWGEGQLI
jgi:hypothetical protein